MKFLLQSALKILLLPLTITMYCIIIFAISGLYIIVYTFDDALNFKDYKDTIIHVNKKMYYIIPFTKNPPVSNIDESKMSGYGEV